MRSLAGKKFRSAKQAENTGKNLLAKIFSILLIVYVMLIVIRTHAVLTPKPCQGRKAAAIRDA